jgi:hypothetical protein
MLFNLLYSFSLATILSIFVFFLSSIPKFNDGFIYIQYAYLYYITHNENLVISNLYNQYPFLTFH